MTHVPLLQHDLLAWSRRYTTSVGCIGIWSSLDWQQLHCPVPGMYSSPPITKNKFRNDRVEVQEHAAFLSKPFIIQFKKAFFKSTSCIHKKLSRYKHTQKNHASPLSTTCAFVLPCEGPLLTATRFHPTDRRMCYL